MDYRRNGAVEPTVGACAAAGPVSNESKVISSGKSDPFISPDVSMPPSTTASATGSGTGIHAPQQRYFHSRRVRKGEAERPWLDRKDPKEKWVTIIPLVGILVGLGVTGFLVYDGLKSVAHHNYCPVLMEDWSNGFNTDVWQKEVELGGYG